MKNSKARRDQAVANYKKAIAQFTSEKNGKTWRQCLEDAGCDHKYPFMDLSKFSKRTDIDLAISDLIGFCGRLSWQSGNAPYMEAVVEVMTETRVDVHNIEAFSDIELCKEFNKRGIHENEEGEFVKIVITEVPIEGVF